MRKEDNVAKKKKKKKITYRWVFWLEFVDAIEGKKEKDYVVKKKTKI